VGIEEGVLPHQRSIEDARQLEEERRLFYVGITRAMRGLYLVRAFRRTMYGTSGANTPSRFLLDVPPELARVTHASGVGRSGGTNAFSSPRQERSGLTRQEARELAARAFTPYTAQPRTGERTPRPPRTEEPTYQSGDKVRHPTFGVGIVVAVRSDASAEIIEVNFAGGIGVKKLDTAFAPLSRE
jgi:DNA helicase-2/ATP-dependent DNA helicase PcrA